MTLEEVSKQLTVLTKEIDALEKTVGKTLSDKIEMLFVMAGDAMRLCTDNMKDNKDNADAIKDLTKQITELRKTAEKSLADKISVLFVMAGDAVRLCGENSKSADENEKDIKDLVKRVAALEKKK